MLSIDDQICTVEQYDRLTERLRFAAVLRGDSTAEIVELTRAREDERARIMEECFGPQCAD
jgi:hypothetical protein